MVLNMMRSPLASYSEIKLIIEQNSTAAVSYSDPRRAQALPHRVLYGIPLALSLSSNGTHSYLSGLSSGLQSSFRVTRRGLEAPYEYEYSSRRTCGRPRPRPREAEYVLPPEV